MTGRLPENIHDKLSLRLRYYEDIGIREFFRDRITPAGLEPRLEEVVSQTAVDMSYEGVQTMSETPPPAPLITAIPKIGEGTLQTIREDIGDCTRCKLHKGRTKIVFGDGHPHAKLLFIGEGPGRDEDLQGLPFVGRAGKLLTQMIEAMGLRRSDVYICNVVKCRPPENRAPERDEVAACSPFFFRRIDLADDRSHGAAAQRRVYMQRGEVPAAGESRTRKR